MSTLSLSFTTGGFRQFSRCVFLATTLLVTQTTWAVQPGYQQIIGAWRATDDNRSLYFYYDNTLKLIRTDGSVGRGNWVVAQGKIKLYRVTGKSRVGTVINLTDVDRLNIPGAMEFSGSWQRVDKHLVKFLWG